MGEPQLWWYLKFVDKNLEELEQLSQGCPDSLQRCLAQDHGQKWLRVHEALDDEWHVAEDVMCNPTTAKQVLISTGVRTEQLVTTRNAEETGKIAPEAHLVPPASTAPLPALPTAPTPPQATRAMEAAAPPPAPAVPNSLRPEGADAPLDAGAPGLASHFQYARTDRIGEETGKIALEVHLVPLASTALPAAPPTAPAPPPALQALEAVAAALAAPAVPHGLRPEGAEAPLDAGAPGPASNFQYAWTEVGVGTAADEGMLQFFCNPKPGDLITREQLDCVALGGSSAEQLAEIGYVEGRWTAVGVLAAEEAGVLSLPGNPQLRRRRPCVC